MSATIYIEREDRQFCVTVIGTFHKGSRGYRVGAMDRFALPDDPDEYEDIVARDAAGREVELTEDEVSKAEAALMAGRDS